MSGKWEGNFAGCQRARVRRKALRADVLGKQTPSPPPTHTWRKLLDFSYPLFLWLMFLLFEYPPMHSLLLLCVCVSQ